MNIKLIEVKTPRSFIYTVKYSFNDKVFNINISSPITLTDNYIIEFIKSKLIKK